MDVGIVVSNQLAFVIGDRIGVNWRWIALEDFRRGLEVELQMAAIDPRIPESCHNAIEKGKLVFARLQQTPRYYDSISVAVSVR